MSGFLLRIFIGIALAFAAHAQPKPPPDKAPTNDTKPPAAPTAQGQRLDNALAMCIGCHGIPGYKTAFPEVYHVPKIAGQQPAYIVNALKAYKSGERSHPSMRGIAATLTDEDMKKLAELLRGARNEAARAGRSVSRSPARRTRRAMRAAGKEKAAQVCAACHGPEGNKPSDPTQPILAGQHYDYLVRALTDYKIGRRNNPIMKGFAVAAFEEGHRGPGRLVLAARSLHCTTSGSKSGSEPDSIAAQPEVGL